MKILTETHELLKKIKKETGVPFYRIIHDSLILYVIKHNKKRKPIKFEFGGESK